MKNKGFDFFLMFGLLLGLGLAFLGLHKESLKKCDCGKICNSEFKCGLKECPTGRTK